MDLPYEILEMQAVVAHPSAYETKPITPECATRITSASKIHLSVLSAYLKTENAPAGHIRRNKNNTHDVGPMQINTVNWMSFHNRYQLTPLTLRFDGCSNLLAGAKLVREKFQQHERQDIQTWDIFYQVAAEYHSSTPEHNASYQTRWISNFNYILENGIEHKYR